MKKNSSVKFKQTSAKKKKSQRKRTTPYNKGTNKNGGNISDLYLTETTLRTEISNNSSSTKFCQRNGKIESSWIKEPNYGTSPSLSEFSENSAGVKKRPDTNDFDISIQCSNDVSVPDLSHLFDTSSSESSSSSDSRMDFFSQSFTKDSTYYSQSDFDVTSEMEVVNVDEGWNVDVSTSDVLEPTNNNNIYDITDGYIVVLKSNCPLYFHGVFLLSVLYGSLDVLGATLTPDSEEVEVYSLRGSSYLVFESRHREANLSKNQLKHVDVEKLLNNVTLDGATIQRVEENFSRGDTILFCREFTNQKMLFLEQHVAQQLLPKSELSCTFREDPADWNVLKINEDWENLMIQIRSTSRVMLCGGKGVGKSTLLKFTINRLLMSYSSVVVIDLDPGQPEFTVSGCVSATIVTKPIFGPNYTHLSAPDRCIFVGNINVSHDPSEYLNCVKELLTECSDLPNDVPTIINYMGYSRALGLNLAATIISYVAPTHLVQIASNRKQRNFVEKLTTDAVNEHAKLLDSIGGNLMKYDFIEFESMTDENDGWHMAPRTIRELCVLSYMSEMLGSNNLSLTSSEVPIYKVDLRNICIIASERINEPSIANANMVALCASSGSKNIFKCYGWGIVRGINVISNELYLLSPISADILENVSHLVIGSINLPPAVYMNQHDKLGIVPYVSSGLITDFNSIPKRTYLHKNTYLV